MNRAVRLLTLTAAAGALLLGDAAHVAAADPPPSVSDTYVHRVWSERDGLPSGRIWSITQDRDGYLWLGSDLGLVRFDGVRAVFQPTRSATPRPEDKGVVTFAARDGSLWVGYGTGGGVTRISGSSISTYGSAQGLATGRVTAIVEDLDGNTWVSGNRGLFVFREGIWRSIGAGSALPQGQVTGLFVDALGGLVAATPQGIFKKERRQTTFTQISDIGSVQAVQFTLQKHTGLLITDDREGYVAVTARSADRHTSRYGRGIQLMSDSRDRLWLATEAHGLWVIDPESSSAENVLLSTQEGVDSNTVRALFEDREGNVWVGTLSGLHEFTPRVVAAALLETPFSILSGNDGRMLVGSAGVLSEVSAAGAVLPLDASAPGVTNVRALYRDRTGAVWIGSDAGVFRLEGRRPTLVPAAATLKNLTSMAGTRDGTIYLCDQNRGVFRWRQGHLDEYRHPLDADNLGAFIVFSDRHDRVWFGYPGGRLGLIDADGAARWFTPSDGLTPGSVLSIFEDRDSEIWVGGNEGMSLYSGGEFQTVKGDQGRPLRGVIGIAQDAQGDMWVAAIGGIVHFKKGDFIDAIRTGEPIRQARYDQADGLAGLPISLASTPNVATDADGRLWFVTSSGLSIIDPARLSSPMSLPVARIETIHIQSAPTNRAGRVAAYFVTPAVHVEYTALSFRAPTRLRFRYRLEGRDTTWTDANGARSADFTGLPPGRYRFSVVAADGSGIWSERVSSADFTVPTPPLRTGWAHATASALLVGIGLALWGLRLRRVKRQLGIVLAERIRMSQEIHDTLVQGLVGIALQLDAASAAVAEPAVAQQLSVLRRRVEQYIGDAREAIRTLRLRPGGSEQVWDALAQTGKTLGEAYGFQFDMKRSLGTGRPAARQCEQQLLRIGQEAVFNAAKHANATRVHVEVEYAPSTTTLRVTDDGCGFVEETRSDEHFGIKIMRERAEQVGGHLEIRSAHGHGTSVVAVVPHS